MTTLTRDPITNGFKLPDDPTNRFNTATGQPNPNYSSLINPNAGLAPGVTGTYNPATTGVTFNIPPTTSNPPQTSPSSPSSPTTSFTTALIALLKDAQQRDVTGQAKLLGQSQQIEGQGLADAARNFNNPMLAPNSGTSLGNSAQNEFDPATLSIKNQQELATKNLANIKDTLKETQDAYDKEQERIAKAKEKASNLTFDTQANISHQVSAFERIKGAPYLHPDGTFKSDHDNYVAPEAWLEALKNWQINGGSYSEFLSNFKRYVNPDDYSAVGLNDTGA